MIRLLLLLLFPALLWAQDLPWYRRNIGNGAPSSTTTCFDGAIYIRTDTNETYTCFDSTWIKTGVSTVRVYGVTIDGGGEAISTGSKGFAYATWSCTISKWVVLADQSGSVVVDVKRVAEPTWPATSITTASIVGAGNKPTLSSKQGNAATPAAWTSVAIAAGDIIEFNVDSVTSVTRLTLVLKCTE